MMDAECGMQTRSDYGACHRCSVYGIAVVEQIIQTTSTSVTPEPIAKKQVPVAACTLSFNIVRITGPDFTD